MKHRGIRPGAVRINGGTENPVEQQRPISATPSHIGSGAVKHKLEAKPFVPSYQHKKSKAEEQLALADDMEDLIKDCYDSLDLSGPIESNMVEIDTTIETIVSGMRNLFYALISEKCSNLALDDVVNMEQIRVIFSVIGYVVKLLITKKKLDNRKYNMLRSSVKFAFESLGLKDSQEEFNYMTVIDFIVETFGQSGDIE